MSTVYTNIAELVTNDPTVGDGSPLGLLTDAALAAPAMVPPVPIRAKRGFVMVQVSEKIMFTQPSGP